MAARRSLRRPGLLALNIILVLALSSCDYNAWLDTEPPPATDECFAPEGQARYWDGDALLDVTYTDGSISANATPPRGSEFEILSFTGAVTETGRAAGTATVWVLYNDSVRSFDFPLELSLNDGASCAERNTLSYSFHFVTILEGVYLPVSGNFAGTREAE